jgi:hypothetical protein
VGALAPLFTSVETAHNIAFSLTNAAATTVFGNPTGSTGAPSYYVPNAAIVNGWLGYTAYNGAINPNNYLTLITLPKDTLHIVPQTNTGLLIGNASVSGDSIMLDRLQSGANITLTKNADSSITIASSGTGGSMPPNIGTGYRIYAPQVPGIKTLFCVGCALDSTTNTNALTITVGSGNMGIGNVITGATPGSRLYAGTGGVLQQSNAVNFYDSTHVRWGYGTNTPTNTIDVDSARSHGYKGGLALEQYLDNAVNFSRLHIYDSAQRVYIS